MLDFSSIQNCYIAYGYMNMRNHIDDLTVLAQTQFWKEMDEILLYLFCGRRTFRIETLYWYGTKYILLYNYLTESGFSVHKTRWR